MSARIGLFGGSFDPVHNGHLLTVRAAAEDAGFERVILLPSANPPNKIDESLTDVTVRLTMVRTAVGGDHLFEVDDYDARRSGPTYTIDTVRHFRQTYGDVAWLIGGDSLADLHNWHRVPDLVDECEIVTLVRPGWEDINWQPLLDIIGPGRVDEIRNRILTTPRIDISSTQVRERIAAGRSIRYMVPEAVETIIEREGLYQS